MSNENTLKSFLDTIDPEYIEQAVQSSDDIESPEALRRTHDMTVAMLKYAHSLLNEAEGRMDEQAKRIKSLENLALTDELTDILNRRGFEKAVKQELARLNRRHLKGGAFCLIDLDGFKPINDTYGHQFGDLCLKELANCLKDITRTTDIVGRLGGDEFAIYLSNIDEKQVQAKIDVINTALNSIIVKNGDKETAIKASIGYIMVTHPADPYEDIYERADQHMYRTKTKRKGRRSQKEKILSETNVL